MFSWSLQQPQPYINEFHGKKQKSNYNWTDRTPSLLQHFVGDRDTESKELQNPIQIYKYI